MVIDDALWAVLQDDIDDLVGYLGEGLVPGDGLELA
jgi:hypothetical protein